MQLGLRNAHRAKFKNRLAYDTAKKLKELYCKKMQKNFIS